jgi:small-conductance mechanosensitive channel
LIDWPAIGESLGRGVPLLATVVLGGLGLWFGHWLLSRRRGSRADLHFATQIWSLLGVVLVLVMAIVAAPVESETRGQLLSLVGLALTAILALASTSFVANAMAGLMLRAVGSFRPGDFVRSDGAFGRVTERGLFHTEIQTEDRDLTTVPNLHLVTRPFTVVSASGTIVSADVSLGYDVPRSRVEALLLEAGRAAGLDEPFVQVLALGDFAVSYKVAGFLEETRRLLTKRSDLREQMLDVLHRAGIEIVSPRFMNQRSLEPERRFLPKDLPPARAADSGSVPEDRIFDKAEEAGRLEAHREEHAVIEREIAELEAQLAEQEGSDRYRLQRSIDLRRRRIEALEALLDGSASADPAPSTLD